MENNKENNAVHRQRIGAAAFTITLFVGIGVCAICNFAISGHMTWAWFPVSAVIYAWTILFPIIRYGKKGVLYALIALSVFTIPFLFVLSRLITDNALILPIGIRMTVYAAIYLWSVYALFQCFKKRKLIASALSLLFIVPLNILINASLSVYIAQPESDLYNLCYSVIIMGVLILLTAGFILKKRVSSQKV